MNNKLINIEEARNILKFAKRIYRALDGVTVRYGRVFAYYPNELVIEIPKEISEEDQETMIGILKYSNEEFNTDFEYNLRESSIHAFCHEMGHHMDFEGKIFTQQIEDYMAADHYNRHLYDSLCDEFAMKVRAFEVILRQYEAEDEVDEELELAIEQNRIELIYEDEELDFLYRSIPTEYAADEFSARFFMTYLRAYKKCNYSL
jgi:hypothetical protein